ncbi:hypothetical protein ACFV7Q_11005 [Streptomyces sp. NPDC059851]|uniref:hypothetical protein n=1 Tax=Streptomyces sp. NPDC059851 TaxID=3346971 RepID=UPI0036657D60
MQSRASTPPATKTPPLRAMLRKEQRDADGPRWSWSRDPYRSLPYGNSAAELSRHSRPIFTMGHSVIEA